MSCTVKELDAGLTSTPVTRYGQLEIEIKKPFSHEFDSIDGLVTLFKANVTRDNLEIMISAWELLKRTLVHENFLKVGENFW